LPKYLVRISNECFLRRKKKKKEKLHATKVDNLDNIEKFIKEVLKIFQEKLKITLSIASTETKLTIKYFLIKKS
jgi:hypothetical protein